MSSPAGNGVSRGDSAGEGLAGKVSGGFVWLASQAGATKLVGIASQLVLAAILVPADFGQVALVLSFVTFTSILQSGGIRQVLVQQQASFSEWASSGFWLSLIQGVAAGVVLVLAGPISVALYEEPSLLPLLLVAAIAAPLGALGTVPEARLQIAMRFRFLSVVGVTLAVVQAAVAIGMATAGFGALSLIAALAVVAGAQSGIYWVAAPIPVRRPEPRRWKALFSQSAFVLVATFAFAVTTEAAVVSLGLFSTVAEVGLYFFAYNLSVQVVALVTGRLQVVLLPTLSSIRGDPMRQLKAAQRTAAALALGTFPLYALLIVGARPLVNLLYSDKWADAIPLLAVLSLAMIARSVTSPAGVLVLAQGRFRTYMWIHVGSGIFIIVLTVPLTLLFGALGATAAVAVHAYAVLAVAWIVAADRHRSEVARFVGRLAVVFAAGMMAAGMAALAQAPIAIAGAAGDLVRLAVIGILGILVFVGIMHRFAQDALSDMTGQLRALLNKQK